MSELDLIPLSDVTNAATKWLWDQYMPEGELTLLAGREDQGKSQLAAWITAQVSEGNLPGDYQGTACDVLVSSSEDSMRQTIAPRLRAAGAAEDGVHFMRAKTRKKHGVRLTLPEHTDDLEETLKNHEEIGLLVLDPLLSHMTGNLNANQGQDVRVNLEPVIDICHRYRVSLLGLIHLNKNSNTDPKSMIVHSRAWVELARSVMFVTDHHEDEDIKAFSVIKGNLKKKKERDLTLTFTFESVKQGYDMEAQKDVETSRIVIGEPLGMTITEVMTAEEAGAKPETQKDKCQKWLRSYFDELGEDYWQPSSIVKAEAKQAGYSSATIDRAAKAMRIQIRNAQVTPTFTEWALPEESPSIPEGLVSVPKD